MNDKTKKRLIGIADTLSQPLIAVLIALTLGGIVIALYGQNVLRAYGAMLTGAFGDSFYLGGTLTRATPVIMGGLAVCIAWRSGYEAMGGEGQMIFGSMAAALIAYYAPVPGVLRVILAILGAALAGALYSALTGWLFEKLNVTFIISTLMLNYIANNICAYLTAYVFKDPKATDIVAVQTGKIEKAARLPEFAGIVHWGFILALILAVAMWFLFNRTSFGYKSRMGGLNPRFALYGGINARRMLYLVLILSGVMAGLGGAFEVLGSKYRYNDQMIFNAGYAWTGMVAALLANMNPLGTVVASILLAGLSTGGNALQDMKIPLEICKIIEGIIMLLTSVKLVKIASNSHAVRRRQSEAETGGERK